MVVVELILIRHGYACSNATKSIAKSISKNGELPQRLYQDPELTSDGIALCKARRAETIIEIDKYFPMHSYKIGTSSLIRTQQTAYYSLLEGVEEKYSIFPHIAEEGYWSTNIPLEREAQRAFLGPDIIGHVSEDHRGSADESNNSNYIKFIMWIHTLGAKADTLFHITPEGVYRAVIVTHGKIIRHMLKLENKVNNNELFYAKINTETQVISNVKQLLVYPKTVLLSVEGCRFKYQSEGYPVAPAGGSRSKRRLQKRSHKIRRLRRNTSRKYRK
jgi:bisphosphoglycerate-dependent phosphoglycerate mutase